MEKKRNTTVLYMALWVFTIIAAITIAIVTIYNLTYTVSAATWLSFWKYYLTILFFAGLPLVGLFVIGGFMDLMKLFKQLKEERPDEHDDGFVGVSPDKETE